MSKLSKLRELFKKPGFFRLIGAHNGLTARLGERAGFDGMIIRGRANKLTYLFIDDFAREVQLKGIQIYS